MKILLFSLGELYILAFYQTTVSIEKFMPQAAVLLISDWLNQGLLGKLMRWLINV